MEGTKHYLVCEMCIICTTMNSCFIFPLFFPTMNWKAQGQTPFICFSSWHHSLSVNGISSTEVKKEKKKKIILNTWFVVTWYL